MTTQAPDDLRSRYMVSGHIITACSPSADTVTLMWPDLTTQTVAIEAVPTVAVRENGEQCWIYPRGPAFDAILSTIDEELQRQEDDIQDVVTQSRIESDARIESVMLSNDDIVMVEQNVEPVSDLCTYESDSHYDCFICPDPETGIAPKHHDTKPKLTGHGNSKLHKKYEDEAA